MPKLLKPIYKKKAPAKNVALSARRTRILRQFSHALDDDERQLLADGLRVLEEKAYEAGAKDLAEEISWTISKAGWRP